MEFRCVFISNPAQLSVRRGQLVIRQDEEVSIPMEDISSLLLESRAVSITAAALQELPEHGVTVYLCDAFHLPAAVVLPMNRHSRQLKMLKGQIAMSKPAQKRTWQSVVTTKIANQAACLTLMGHPEGNELRFLATQVRSGDPDNLEATAAARYFPAAVHKNRLYQAVPARGAVRMLVITEKQYTGLEILLGPPTVYDAPQQEECLMIF